MGRVGGIISNTHRPFQGRKRVGGEEEFGVAWP